MPFSRRLFSSAYSRSNCPTLTFGDVLDLNRQVGPGFHTLRWLLAVLVLCAHSVTVTQGWSAGLAFMGTLWATPFNFILPFFFSLGGFLVLGSAYRSPTLARFLALRGLRLMPALVVETFLAALVLGSIATTLPLEKYFQSGEVFTYFLNLIGRAQLSLPGVFDSNPWPVVNVSLWMITIELLCYVVAALALFTGVMRRPALVALLTVACLVLNVHSNLINPRGLGYGYSGVQLVLSFTLGAALYVFRHQIPFRRLYCVMAIGGAVFLGRVHEADALALCFLAYAVVFLGLSDLRTNLPLLSSCDLSYGIYLYGFPVQQFVLHIFPSTNTWYLNILIALPITFCIALLSWYLIEQPALSLKRVVATRISTTSYANAAMSFIIILLLVTYGAYMCSRGHVIEIGFASLVRDPHEATRWALAIAAVSMVLMLVKNVNELARPHRPSNSSTQHTAL